MSEARELPVSERPADPVFEAWFEGIYGKRLQARHLHAKTDGVTDAELQELRRYCDLVDAASNTEKMRDLARAVWYESDARRIYDCRRVAAREAWDAAKKPGMRQRSWRSRMMPDDLYTTLVLCPVCGAEIDRLTHPNEKLHGMVAPLASGDRRRKHGAASPACMSDSRWVRGWILVPLGKPEAKS